MLRAALIVAIHLLVAASTFWSALAHYSGDPSGIQYILILRGWAFAALAALVALTARGLGRLGHPRLVAALVITAFFWPAVPGIVAEYGVYEWRDPIGQVLSVAVALGQAAVLGWQVRHFRARRHELLPG